MPPVPSRALTRPSQRAAWRSVWRSARPGVPQRGARLALGLLVGLGPIGGSRDLGGLGGLGGLSASLSAQAAPVKPGKPAKPPKPPKPANAKLIGPSSAGVHTVTLLRGDSVIRRWPFLASQEVQVEEATSDVTFEDGRFVYALVVRGAQSSPLVLSHLWFPCQGVSPTKVRTVAVRRLNRQGAEVPGVFLRPDSTAKLCQVRATLDLFNMVGGSFLVTIRSGVMPGIGTAYVHGWSNPPADSTLPTLTNDGRKVVDRAAALQRGDAPLTGRQFTAIVPTGPNAESVRDAKAAGEAVVAWIKAACKDLGPACKPLQNAAEDARGDGVKRPQEAQEHFTKMRALVATRDPRSEAETMTWRALQAVIAYGEWWAR